MKIVILIALVLASLCTACTPELCNGWSVNGDCGRVPFAPSPVTAP